MRRVLFWMHLSTGVLISILVLFFSITGALLAYERPILRAVDEHSSRVNTDRQQTERLPLDGLVGLAAAAGFWIGLPLTIVVLTGVIMAYPWANAQLFRLAGSPLPVRNGDGANPRRHAPGGSTLPGHLEQPFALATHGVQDWQSASLRLPAGGRGLSFTVDRSDGGHPEKREQVVIDPTTLRVLHQESFAALSRGQQWRSWVRFVHTGEAGGWWGETLAVVTAGGAMVLSLTGVALALNRLQRWRRRVISHA